MSSLDRDVPISDVQTFDEMVDASVATRRFTMTLLASFALLALLLALGGIYGVLAYNVARRTTEIGVRMALGAGAGNVLRLIVGQGLRPVLAGIGVGLLAAGALSQLMTGLLFGVTPIDFVTYALVATSILVAGVAACLVPARKAVRVDVMSALRSE
jgi:ABC-type antimicrobial peptide transport system permease subunit